MSVIMNYITGLSLKVKETSTSVFDACLLLLAALSVRYIYAYKRRETVSIISTIKELI